MWALHYQVLEKGKNFFYNLVILKELVVSTTTIWNIYRFMDAHIAFCAKIGL